MKSGTMPQVKQLWAKEKAKKLAELLSARKLSDLTKQVSDLECLFGKIPQLLINDSKLLSVTKAYVCFLQALYVYAKSHNINLKKVPDFDSNIACIQSRIEELERKLRIANRAIEDFKDYQMRVSLDAKQQEHLARLLEDAPYLNRNTESTDSAILDTLNSANSRLSEIRGWFNDDVTKVLALGTLPKTIILFAAKLNEDLINLYSRTVNKLDAKTKSSGRDFISLFLTWCKCNEDVLHKLKVALSLGDQINTYCSNLIRDDKPKYDAAIETDHLMLLETLPHSGVAPVGTSHITPPTLLSIKMQKIETILTMNITSLQEQRDKIIDVQNSKDLEAAKKWLDEHSADTKEIDKLKEHINNLQKITEVDAQFNTSEFVENTEAILAKLREKMPKKPESIRKRHTRSKANIPPENTHFHAISTKTSDKDIVSIPSNLSTPLPNFTRKRSHTPRLQAAPTSASIGLEEATESVVNITDLNEIAPKIRRQDTLYRQFSLPDVKKSALSSPGSAPEIKSTTTTPRYVKK